LAENYCYQPEIVCGGAGVYETAAEGLRRTAQGIRAAGQSALDVGTRCTAALASVPERIQALQIRFQQTLNTPLPEWGGVTRLQNWAEVRPYLPSMYNEMIHVDREFYDLALLLESELGLT
jgi:hypothetical protein